MPDRDGLEFLATVRESRPELPFVLFSGKGSEEIAAEAISAGVDDYIRKETGTEQYAVLANRILSLVDRRRAEHAAERSEERYHNLVDTAPVPIMLFGPEKRLVYANDAAVEFLNADDRTAIEGQPFTEFLHPEDRDQSQERFRRLMTEGVDVPGRPAGCGRSTARSSGRPSRLPRDTTGANRSPGRSSARGSSPPGIRTERPPERRTRSASQSSLGPERGGARPLDAGDSGKRRSVRPPSRAHGVRRLPRHAGRSLG